MKSYHFTTRHAKKRFSLKDWFLSTSFRVSLIVGVMLLSVLYLIQTNAVSTKGFEISELERQIRVLEYDVRKINVEVATYRSMESVEMRLADLDLVASQQVQYLTPAGNPVARR